MKFHKVDVANISPGDVFKNYRELCRTLNEPILTSNAKTAQLKEWSRYFSYLKDGYKYRIIKVYSTPLSKVDGRYKTSRETQIMQKLFLNYLYSGQCSRYDRHYYKNGRHYISRFYMTQYAMEYMGLISHRAFSSGWDEESSLYKTANEYCREDIKLVAKKYVQTVKLINDDKDSRTCTYLNLYEINKAYEFVYTKLQSIFNNCIKTLESRDILHQDRNGWYYEIYTLGSDKLRISTAAESQLIQDMSYRVLQDLYNEGKITSLNLRAVYHKMYHKQYFLRLKEACMVHLGIVLVCRVHKVDIIAAQTLDSIQLDILEDIEAADTIQLIIGLNENIQIKILSKYANRKYNILGFQNKDHIDYVAKKRYLFIEFLLKVTSEDAQELISRKDNFDKQEFKI